MRNLIISSVAKDSQNSVLILKMNEWYSNEWKRYRKISQFGLDSVWFDFASVKQKMISLLCSDFSIEKPKNGRKPIYGPSWNNIFFSIFWYDFCFGNFCCFVSLQHSMTFPVCWVSFKGMSLSVYMSGTRTKQLIFKNRLPLSECMERTKQENKYKSTHYLMMWDS